MTMAYFDPYPFHGKRESDVICLDKPIFYAMAKTFADCDHSNFGLEDCEAMGMLLSR